MKILLIYPYCLETRTKDDDVRPVPIGLYYIGALLKKQNFTVEIVNWYDINKTPKKIRNLLAKKNPDIIGFSILHANRWGGIEIAQIAKKLNPAVKIVFGGIGPTSLWQHLLTNFNVIDFVVIGEGEFTFLSLAQCLAKKKYEKIQDIKGIAFRQNGKATRTEDADGIADIDNLPNPALYYKYQHVASSRGCPWDCTFCGSPKFWKRKVRFHSAEYFVEQLELLYKKGVTFFYVSDDTFTLQSKRVIDICKIILDKNLKITWVAISRVNCINEEILLWMRKAGCQQISYGVESGSESIRDFLNKDIATEDIKKTFALTKSYGILPRAYFIYGSPGESWETIQESIDLMHEIKPLDMVSYILDIYPGTTLYDKYIKNSKSNDDIWLKKIEDIMYFETDPELSAELVMAFGEKLRTTFYENLHHYATSFELIDNEELYKLHSDFCSRLGMTFSHGDWSNNEIIKEKDETAAKLFQKALVYHPNHTAYLGLGIIYQKKCDFSGSIDILSEGIKHFPHSEQLHICMAISFMNLDDFKRALSCLEKFKASKESRPYINMCRKKLESLGI